MLSLIAGLTIYFCFFDKEEPTMKQIQKACDHDFERTDAALQGELWTVYDYKCKKCGKWELGSAGLH